MEKKFCQFCGNELNGNAKFCGKCGNSVVVQETTTVTGGVEPVTPMQPDNAAKSLLNSATKTIGKYAGEEESLSIDLKELFSEVPKKHTSDEADEIFIVGTKNTTPDIMTISDSWSKPWLFSRIFLAFLTMFVLLYVMVDNFGNDEVIPGLVFIGACMVPFSVLIFFFESNVYRNISIFEVMKILGIGGILSLLSTVFLYEFVEFSDSALYYGQVTTSDAFLISIVEEVGKLIVVLYFVRKYQTNKILNGMLIGCAVGAGFAIFESAGYILSSSENISDILDITIFSSWSSLGGDLAWTAIAGGAIIVVKKTEEFNFNQLLDTRFIFFFGSVIVLHAVWDMGIELLNKDYLIYIILIFVAWIELFVLMNAGLREVNHFKQQAMEN